MGPPTRRQSPSLDPHGSVGSTSRPKGKEPARDDDETRVVTISEVEQLLDRKLQRSIDGLVEIMERMMEKMMDMMAIMERDRREDQERTERNRYEDHERLIERLPQMFVEALAIHGAGSTPRQSSGPPLPREKQDDADTNRRALIASPCPTALAGASDADT
jgi:hypothetical protein